MGHMWNSVTVFEDIDRDEKCKVYGEGKRRRNTISEFGHLDCKEKYVEEQLKWRRNTLSEFDSTGKHLIENRAKKLQKTELEIDWYEKDFTELRDCIVSTFNCSDLIEEHKAEEEVARRCSTVGSCFGRYFKNLRQSFLEMTLSIVSMLFRRDLREIFAERRRSTISKSEHPECIETFIHVDERDQKQKYGRHFCFIEDNMKQTKLIHKQRYNVWICVFLWLDVLLLIFIIVAARHLYLEKHISMLPKPKLCVMCEDLKIHPDDVFLWFPQAGNNNNVCCMNHTANPDAFFDNIVDKWLKNKLAKENRHFIRYKCKDVNATEARKPIIKILGRTRKQTGEHGNVLWGNRSDDAMLPNNGDIIYHEHHGFIEFKKSGLYQIYTQVVLNHNNRWHNVIGKSYIYQHLVVRIEAGQTEERAEIILKSSNSYCLCKIDNQTATSYIGGLFHLSDGDKLAVKVHNKTEIVQVAHMNFIGAFML